MVQAVENAGPARSRKASDRDDPKALVAQHGRDSCHEWAIGEEGVQIEGNGRDRYLLPLRRYGLVQISQRLRVIQPGGLGHRALDQILKAVAVADEVAKLLLPVRAGSGSASVEQPRCARPDLFAWQVRKGQVVLTLEMAAGRFERCPAFLVDEPGKRIGKLAGGVCLGSVAVSFDMEHPARSEATQRIVQASRYGEQLRFGRAVQIRAAVAQGSLKGAVLVQHYSRRDETCPGQPVGKPGGQCPEFAQIQHGRPTRRARVEI